MTTDTTTAKTAERILAGVWADILGHDRVNPGDNFFELGGDSVMSVRVCARAARAGIDLTPQHLLRYHTLRDLARSVAGPGHRHDEDDTELGPGEPAPAPAQVPQDSGASIPLTAIMHRFLTGSGPQALRDFTVPMVIEVAAGCRGHDVRAALQHLTEVHETLRYRLRHNALGWRIECAGDEPSRLVDTVVLPPMGEAEEFSVLAADVQQLTADVDIERGPALRARFYDRGSNRTGLLSLVIHHAVFDNMAAIALLDDLDSALEQLSTQRPLSVAPRPATWRQWSRSLNAMSVSDEAAGELSYWTAILTSGSASVPERRDDPPGETTAAVLRTLEPAQVPAVLRARDATSREAAYAAIACGIARWQGTPGAYVMTEGEATPNIYRAASRGHAVGWFTTVHPLYLPADPDRGVGACLPEVSDRLRSVPNDGVGYGILRHLSPPSPAVARLRALAEPAILVTHLGTDTSSFDRGLRHLRNRIDLQVRLKTPQTAGFGIVISSWISDGALTVAVLHDTSFGAEEITALADHLAAALAEPA